MCFNFLGLWLKGTFELMNKHNIADQLVRPVHQIACRVMRTSNRMMDETDARICDLCGYSTSKASNFKRHKIIHSGEKPYKCGSCDYSCTTNDSLKKHSYTHTGDKPHQCSSYDYSSTSTGALKTHSYTHTAVTSHVLQLVI